MGDDRTVVTLRKPRFAINEQVFCRASALRGFVEPLRVTGVRYDNALRQYAYAWSYDVGPSISAYKQSPVEVVESQLISNKEALQIKLSVLKRELAEMERKRSLCSGTQAAETVELPQETMGRIDIPRPKYGINQIVYLKETAMTAGRLESYRITNARWDVRLMQWVYEMFIGRRPERCRTVGDRAELIRDGELSFHEAALCSVCEAITLSINLLTSSINSTELKLKQLE